MKRKNGFYWVKFGLEWTIGEYCGDEDDTYWHLIGLSPESDLTDDSFEEINENRITQDCNCKEKEMCNGFYKSCKDCGKLHSAF